MGGCARSQLLGGYPGGQLVPRISAVVRAGMNNGDIAGALGINLKSVFTRIFVLGAFTAGLCGLLAATGLRMLIAGNELG